MWNLRFAIDDWRLAIGQRRPQPPPSSANILALFRFHAYLLLMTAEGVCAVILAGGKSRRMGFNKALLDVEGRSLIQILADRVRPLASQAVISSNDDNAYRFLNLPVIPDLYQNCGPLAGVHAAMLWLDCPLYIVLACDLPNLQPSHIRRLLDLVGGYDAAIPRTGDGLAHPLSAVYRRTCLPVIENSLRQGAHKVIETFLGNALQIRWVSPDEGRFKDTDLANINTPEDLQRLKIAPLSKTGPDPICSS